MNVHVCVVMTLECFKIVFLNIFSKFMLFHKVWSCQFFMILYFYLFYVVHVYDLTVVVALSF
jgi:hypothetical protein